MKNHLLLNKAYVYPKRVAINDPDDCEYDTIFGAWFWRINNNKITLVKSPNPDRPVPTTKKHDIETGEDLKGE